MTSQTLHYTALLIMTLMLTSLAGSRSHARGDSQESQKDKPGTVQWGQEANGVRCAVTMLSGLPKVGGGDLVRVLFLTENGGNKVLHAPISAPSFFSLYKLTVLQPDGKPASLTAFGHEELKALERRGGWAARKLEPRDQYKVQVPLSRMYDMSLAGEYQVFFSQEITDRVAKTSVTVTSNVLKISVAK